MGVLKTGSVMSERGSTLPLIIGLASLLLATILTTSELQSLMLQRNRALSDARFAALYIAKQVAGIPPVPNFDYGSAVLPELPGVGSVSVLSPDGKTFSARVCHVWESPFGIHSDVEICDEAKVRVIA